MKHISLPLFFCFSLVACSDSSSSPGSAGGQGELAVLVTDKPFAYDVVKSAVVRIDEVEVHQDANAEDGFITLHSGSTLEFDLLDLTNGVTAFLARADVPVGSYEQLRLHVAGGRLELIDGDVFSTEAGNLHLTSTGTSGLKIFIDPPIVVVSEESSTLLLDFDLSKTFQAVPGNDALNADKYLLKPVVHAVNLTETGEISGTVRHDDGSGNLVPVDMATVHLQPFGDPDPANSVATTASAADGTYHLIGVPPGTWDVLAIKDAEQGTASGVTVTIGNVTHADIVIGEINSDDGPDAQLEPAAEREADQPVSQVGG